MPPPVNHNKHSAGHETSSHMVVMPSNNSGLRVGRLCGKYPDRMGWLIGPGGWRKPPTWMPVALDNGAYGAWSKSIPWDESAWLELVATACKHCNPIWAVVPDVVTNRGATIESWNKYAPRLRSEYPNLPLAFAAQDGMTPKDVPGDADMLFIGGSFDWKWASLEMWTKHFQKVHVARVNTERLLWLADKAGAVSCDGTGWFRGGDEKLDELEHYLEFSDRLDRHCPCVLSDPNEYFEMREAPGSKQEMCALEWMINRYLELADKYHANTPTTP